MLRPTLIALGCILLLAAVGKLALLLTDPFADLKTGYPISLLWTAVVIELVLAGLVLFRMSDRFLQWIYSCFFWVLLLVSTSRWFIGYESCDCLGLINVPIYLSVFVNSFALVLLHTFRPSSQKIRQTTIQNFNQTTGSSDAPSVKMKYFGYIVGLLCMVIFSLLYFDLLGAKSVFLALNKPLRTRPVELRGLVVDEDLEAKVEIENNSPRPTTIIGMAFSCTCMAVYDEHPTIEAWGSTAVKIRIRPTRLGHWRQRAVFFTDNPTQGRITVNFFGFVSSNN